MAPKFKTIKRTAPNGYEYEVQVVDDVMHATVRDDPNPRGRVGTERKQGAGEDKRHPGTGDKQADAETANEDDKPAARRASGRRPGAAPRKTS